MPDTPTATPDAEGCVLETYEAHTPPDVRELPQAEGSTHAVYVCRSHGWTATGPPGDDARGAALVAAHKASLSGRVINPDAGALVIEVRDPSLYEHPDLVEGLRAAAGARTVIGIDPAAMELYVTPDELVLEALQQALDGISSIALEDAAGKLANRLKVAGYYLVRVDPELARRREQAVTHRPGRPRPPRGGRRR